MKKLFSTFVSLLVAVTAMADCGLFFGDLDMSTIGTTNESSLVVSLDQIAVEMEIPMGAYFSARLSAIDCEITYPQGMTVVSAERGEDMAIEYMTARGRVATAYATIYGLYEPFTHILSTTGDAGYWQDPESDNPTAWVSYGVVKWEAGLHNEMLKCHVIFDADFTGGDIVVVTNVSSGSDSRGGTVADNGDKGKDFTFTCHVTVEGAETPLPAIEPQINFNAVADGVFINVEDATSYEVIVNGVNMGEIEYVAADYYSKLIKVNAVNETPGHAKGEASEEYELGALMKQPVEAPVITTTMDDDYVYVHIQWPAETDGVRVYTGQDQYPRGQYDYEAAVTAYVGEGSQWQASPETHYVVEVPSNWKVYETADPVVTTSTTADQMIVTATGEGTVTLYVTVYDDENMTSETHTVTGQGSASYAIDRGDEDITISYYATAVADVQGYDEVVPGITRTIYDFVPAKEGVEPPTPTEKTGAPTFNGYTEDGIYAYFLEINQTEPSTIYYRIQYPDGTWSEWAEYEGMLSFNSEGKYRVEAYAVAPGKLPSDEIAYEFVLSNLTGVLEVTSDKQAACVRYFNLAGQEMQEANGLTIVVTTYTDGTTSAVKVMK